MRAIRQNTEDLPVARVEVKTRARWFRCWAAVLAFWLCAAGRLGAQQQEPVVSQEELGFRWKPALTQASFFLGIQHGARLFQEKTHHQLGGPFWKDYWESIRGLRGWEDGDSFVTNYVAHPIQGAISGYIQIQNDPLYRRDRFGSSPHYWTSRLRAFSFAFVYSTLFELGPASEASVGNVGLKPGTMGFVDFVVTPVGGLGWIVAEDALDRYLIERIELRTENRALRALARSTLNPSRSFANLLRLKSPWYRDGRGSLAEYH